MPTSQDPTLPPSSDHPARSVTARRPRPALRTLSRLLIVAAFIAVARSVVADWNDVPTGSMRPTILEGDRIVVDKLAYGLRIPFTESWLATWSGPHRGDVVTFLSPSDGVRMVKRVIGIPGDHVRLDHNALIINGQAADYTLARGTRYSPAPDGTMLPVVMAEEQLPGPGNTDIADSHTILLTPALPSPRTFGELIVPEGVYFVMGDNRDLSHDSRFIGFVPRCNIYGRVWSVAMSLDPWTDYAPRWERWFSGLR